MKKIYRYFFAAMAIASTASCAEQIDDTQVSGGQAPAGFAQMTISASLGDVTKTVYDNQNVLWEGTESITVFSKGSETDPSVFDMTECSDDKTSAKFSGLADLTADSYYAVYPDAAAVSCTPEGVLTVNIPAEQTAVAGSFASGSNVAVAGFAKDDAGVMFNNVCALIAFAFDTEDEAANTAKVTFKVKNSDSEYMGIAGNVSVSFDGDVPVVSAGDAYQVDLIAPADGFASDVVYYVPVCPLGDFSGLQISYTAKDEFVFDKNNSTAGELKRSKLLELGAIPDPYGGFPNDFQITLDFSAGWPFIEPCPEAYTDQIGDVAPNPSTPDIKNGKYFTYNWIYEFGESRKINILQSGLALGKNCGGYIYEEKAHIRFLGISLDESTIANINYGGLIKIPSVEGRYLTKVEIYNVDVAVNTSGDGPQFNIVSSWPAVNKSNSTSRSSNGYMGINIPFSSGDIIYITEPNSLCGIRVRQSNVKITKLVFTYSKTKPE